MSRTAKHTAPSRRPTIEGLETRALLTAPAAGFPTPGLADPERMLHTPPSVSVPTPGLADPERMLHTDPSNGFPTPGLTDPERMLHTDPTAGFPTPGLTDPERMLHSPPLPTTTTTTPTATPATTTETANPAFTPVTPKIEIVPVRVYQPSTGFTMTHSINLMQLKRRQKTNHDKPPIQIMNMLQKRRWLQLKKIQFTQAQLLKAR